MGAYLSMGNTYMQFSPPVSTQQRQEHLSTEGDTHRCHLQCTVTHWSARVCHRVPMPDLKQWVCSRWPWELRGPHQELTFWTLEVPSASRKVTDITHCIMIFCRTPFSSGGKVDITLKTSSETSNELRTGDSSTVGSAYGKNKLLNITKAVINILHIRSAKRQLSDEEEQYEMVLAPYLTIWINGRKTTEPYIKTHERFEQRFEFRFEYKRRKHIQQQNSNSTVQDLGHLLCIAAVLIMRTPFFFLEANYFHFFYYLIKMHSKQNPEPDPALPNPINNSLTTDSSGSRIYPFLWATLWAFNSITPYSPNSSMRLVVVSSIIHPT